MNVGAKNQADGSVAIWWSGAGDGENLTIGDGSGTTWTGTGPSGGTQVQPSQGDGTTVWYNITGDAGSSGCSPGIVIGQLPEPPPPPKPAEVANIEVSVSVTALRSIMVSWSGGFGGALTIGDGSGTTWQVEGMSGSKEISPSQPPGTTVWYNIAADDGRAKGCSPGIAVPEPLDVGGTVDGGTEASGSASSDTGGQTLDLQIAANPSRGVPGQTTTFSWSAPTGSKVQIRINDGSWSDAGDVSIDWTIAGDPGVVSVTIQGKTPAGSDIIGSSTFIIDDPQAVQQQALPDAPGGPITVTVAPKAAMAGQPIQVSWSGGPSDGDWFVEQNPGGEMSADGNPMNVGLADTSDSAAGGSSFRVINRLAGRKDAISDWANVTQVTQQQIGKKPVLSCMHLAGYKPLDPPEAYLGETVVFTWEALPGGTLALDCGGESPMSLPEGAESAQVALTYRVGTSQSFQLIHTEADGSETRSEVFSIKVLEDQQVGVTTQQLVTDGMQLNQQDGVYQVPYGTGVTLRWDGFAPGGWRLDPEGIELPPEARSFDANGPPAAGVRKTLKLYAKGRTASSGAYAPEPVEMVGIEWTQELRDQADAYNKKQNEAALGVLAFEWQQDADIRDQQIRDRDSVNDYLLAGIVIRGVLSGGVEDATQQQNPLHLIVKEKTGIKLKWWAKPVDQNASQNADDYQLFINSSKGGDLTSSSGWLPWQGEKSFDVEATQTFTLQYKKRQQGNLAIGNEVLVETVSEDDLLSAAASVGGGREWSYVYPKEPKDLGYFQVQGTASFAISGEIKLDGEAITDPKKEIEALSNVKQWLLDGDKWDIHKLFAVEWGGQSQSFEFKGLELGDGGEFNKGTEKGYDPEKHENTSETEKKVEGSISITAQFEVPAIGELDVELDLISVEDTGSKPELSGPAASLSWPAFTVKLGDGVPRPPGMDIDLSVDVTVTGTLTPNWKKIGDQIGKKLLEKFGDQLGDLAGGTGADALIEVGISVGFIAEALYTIAGTIDVLYQSGRAEELGKAVEPYALSYLTAACKTFEAPFGVTPPNENDEEFRSKGWVAGVGAAQTKKLQVAKMIKEKGGSNPDGIWSDWWSRHGDAVKGSLSIASGTELAREALFREYAQGMSDDGIHLAQSAWSNRMSVWINLWGKEPAENGPIDLWKHYCDQAKVPPEVYAGHWG